MFVVTAGEGSARTLRSREGEGQIFWKRTRSRRWRSNRAEATAEWVHRRIRAITWGFPDPPSMTMQERFTSRYRGKRYSFGYPACPNLDDQAGRSGSCSSPEEIGVELTDGMMMEPEASVSALVFHHPDAVYFTASDDREEAAGAAAD